MVQTINFILLPWLPLILSMPRGAAQSAVQPVPTFASHQKWDPSIAAMVGALFCAFLFMGFFSIFLRHCSAQRVTANGGGDWPCACSEGIDQKVLDTFPVLVYSTIRDLKIGKADLECAVCLNEFKDLDSLRLLPKCSHVFHPSCIEAWLSSHVTCPVCRQKLSPDYEHVAITVSSDELEGDDREEEEKGEEVEVAVEAAVRGDRMRRSNSTGHCDCEVERCTLRLPEDVRRYILANRRRSASYDNLGMSMVGGLVQQHMSD